MEKQLTVREVLQRGIARELESQTLYTDLGARAAGDPAKYAFRKLVTEEKRHQETLEKYLAGGIPEGALEPSRFIDYKIAESLEQPKISPTMNLADIFLLAANREKMSNEFYLGLAGIHPSGRVKKLFIKMASEELGHKQKMESMYAEVAFPQTDGG